MSDSGFDPNRPVGIDRSDPVPDQAILDEGVAGGPSLDQITPGTGTIGNGPKIPGSGGAMGDSHGFADTNYDHAGIEDLEDLESAPDTPRTVSDREPVAPSLPSQ